MDGPCCLVKPSPSPAIKVQFSGNNMLLSPRAMVAFGEAIRTGGAPVVSARWIETSWKPRTRSLFFGHDYGYG
jgi:hypothetical protein